MVRVDRGTSTVVWPSPVLQSVGGVFLAGFCAASFFDVVAATDLSLNAKMVFASPFLMLAAVALRILTSRVILAPSQVIAIGVLPAKRFERSEVTDVTTVAIGYAGPRLAFETTAGQRLLPMSVSGTRRQREAMGAVLQEWL